MIKKAIEKVASLIGRVNMLERTVNVVSASAQSIADSIEKIASTVLENRKAINIIMARQDHILRQLQALGVEEADLLDAFPVAKDKNKSDLLN